MANFMQIYPTSNLKMSEYKLITYTFRTYEAYEQYDFEVRKLIFEEVSDAPWMSNDSCPPNSAHPPPLTTDTIEKIKGLSRFIEVTEIEMPGQDD